MSSLRPGGDVIALITNENMIKPRGNLIVGIGIVGRGGILVEWAQFWLSGVASVGSKSGGDGGRREGERNAVSRVVKG